MIVLPFLQKKVRKTLSPVKRFVLRKGKYE